MFFWKVNWFFSGISYYLCPKLFWNSINRLTVQLFLRQLNKTQSAAKVIKFFRILRKLLKINLLQQLVESLKKCGLLYSPVPYAFGCHFAHTRHFKFSTFDATELGQEIIWPTPRQFFFFLVIHVHKIFRRQQKIISGAYTS